jgi:SAM-dependent methyltransferase
MDYRLGLFRALNSVETKSVLRAVYLKGSLVDGSVSLESGRGYLTPILRMIEEHGDIAESDGLIEIGFGNATILNELARLGYSDLTGIEPGGHSTVAVDDCIQLLYDFFPSTKINRKFGVVFHFGVLEHVEEPEVFLRHCFNNLTENGVLVFAVPNCEPYITEGDTSMFIHEHYSYFTRESIIRVVEYSGGEVFQIDVVLGMLFVSARKSIADDHVKISFDHSRAQAIESEFWSKVEKYVSAVKYQSKRYDMSSEGAFYPGIRAMNLLYLVGQDSVRLIDDSSQNHSKFLPFQRRAIESFEQLCAAPPKIVFVCSKTYEDVIVNRCKNDSRLNQTSIVTLSELLRQWY